MPPSAEQTCLAACAPGDVNCQAVCVGVPHPGAAQMNETTDCVAQCPQGDGSPAAISTYSSCQQGCISSYILGGATAGKTATSLSTTASGKASGTGTTATTGASSKGWAAGSVGAGVGGWLGMVLGAVAVL
jgi:hypothetical protein